MATSTSFMARCVSDVGSSSISIGPLPMILPVWAFVRLPIPGHWLQLNLKSIRETLEALKGSFLSEKPPTILSYADVCDGVGFNKYYELEESDQYEGSSTGTHGHQFT